ncbi:thrombospondin type 3 repeat-containing protein [Lewinella sp. LCG006]|uniref:thrombospondin type 3 repeat-containing protein n=1 Tax=Lewinella sp. LCG006 TaxID=3231911 RepID=UPI003460FE78
MNHLSQLYLFILAFIGLYLSIPLAGQQEARWSIGASAGQTIYQGDISQDGFGSLRGNTYVWGGSLRYRPSDFWSVGLQGHYGELAGADRFYTNDPYRIARDFEFTTTFKDIAFTTQFYPLGRLRLQPEVGIGIGLVSYSPEAFLLDNTHLELSDLIKDDLEAVRIDPAWIIPLQFGLSCQVTTSLGLETGMVYTFTETDYLDGVSVAANPGNRDRYGAFYFGLNLHFGYLSDIDEDGIPDVDDLCPLKPGPAHTRGCPDADGDGLRDSDDRCPLAAGDPFFNGCPDTDGDGTADPYDRCPAVAGPPEALGCPLKDSDNDGLSDHLDDCPLVAGPKDRRGCPAIDTDLDGLLDEDDRCPEKYGIPLFQGCPDTDGDGIEDDKDACPNTFGYYDEGGCPLLNDTKEEARMLEQQILFFRTNSADLSNFMLLDRMVLFLKENPNYRLFVNGHADSEDREQAPGYLSQLRAERVKRYLLDSGVPLQQIAVRGHSNREPLLNANSPTEHQRVVFRLEGY